MASRAGDHHDMAQEGYMEITPSLDKKQRDRKSVQIL